MLSWSYLLFVAAWSVIGGLVVAVATLAPRAALRIFAILVVPGLLVFLALIVMVVVADPVGSLAWGAFAIVAATGIPLALMALAGWVKGRKDPAWKAFNGWDVSWQAAKERRALRTVSSPSKCRPASRSSPQRRCGSGSWS